MPATEEFNLVTSPWIPVLRRTGRFERIGILEVLTKSGSIRQIAASNPMDNVALLRFLLALLLWCRPGLDEAERRGLDGATGIPEDWLMKLGTGQQPEPAFNLLGDGKRFYQDPSLQRQRSRPIGDLLVEFPTDTKIAHFRHVRDMQYGMCPACCGKGIVRFCAFANYAGSGYTSGINGPAPAYAIMQGATLLETLRLNWPSSAEECRQPPWLCPTAPSAADLDVVTVFAWRSRRLWLHKPGDECECVSCGERVRLIRDLGNAGGWKVPFESRGAAKKKFWDQDPHLILVEERSADGEDAPAGEYEVAPRSRRGGGALTTTTLAFPRPGRRVMAHVGFWRRAAGSLRAKSDKANHVVIAGPATTQTGMLYQDATALRLSRLADDATAALESLSKAVESVNGVLCSSALNSKRKHPERKAALDALSASLEADLRCDLLSSQSAEPPTSRIEALRARLAPVVERVVRSTAPGSPLRRREAVGRAQAALDRVLRTAAAPPGGQNKSAPDAAKPKISRRKKGAAS